MAITKFNSRAGMLGLVVAAAALLSQQRDDTEVYVADAISLRSIFFKSGNRRVQPDSLGEGDETPRKSKGGLLSRKIFSTKKSRAEPIGTGGNQPLLIDSQSQSLATQTTSSILGSLSSSLSRWLFGRAKVRPTTPVTDEKERNHSQSNYIGDGQMIQTLRKSEGRRSMEATAELEDVDDTILWLTVMKDVDEFNAKWNDMFSEKATILHLLKATDLARFEKKRKEAIECLLNGDQQSARQSMLDVWEALEIKSLHANKFRSTLMKLKEEGVAPKNLNGNRNHDDGDKAEDDSVLTA